MRSLDSQRPRKKFPFIEQLEERSSPTQVWELGLLLMQAYPFIVDVDDPGTSRQENMGEASQIAVFPAPEKEPPQEDNRFMYLPRAKGTGQQSDSCRHSAADEEPVRRDKGDFFNGADVLTDPLQLSLGFMESPSEEDLQAGTAGTFYYNPSPEPAMGDSSASPNGIPMDGDGGASATSSAGSQFAQGSEISIAPANALMSAAQKNLSGSGSGQAVTNSGPGGKGGGTAGGGGGSEPFLPPTTPNSPGLPGPGPGLEYPLVSIVAITPDAFEEGEVAGEFMVTRTGATTGGLTVSLSITGDAVRPNDYTLVPAITSTITIPAGSSSVNFTVVPVDDGVVEGDEFVEATITGSGNPEIDGYRISDSNHAAVLIWDNSPTVWLSVPDDTAVEPHGGGSGNSTGEFVVHRSGDDSQPLTVNYTVSGSATSGVDYATLSGSVSFSAGEKTTSIPVTALRVCPIRGIFHKSLG